MSRIPQILLDNAGKVTHYHKVSDLPVRTLAYCRPAYKFSRWIWSFRGYATSSPYELSLQLAADRVIHLTNVPSHSLYPLRQMVATMGKAIVGGNGAIQGARCWVQIVKRDGYWSRFRTCWSATIPPAGRLLPPEWMMSSPVVLYLGDKGCALVTRIRFMGAETFKLIGMTFQMVMYVCDAFEAAQLIENEKDDDAYLREAFTILLRGSLSAYKEGKTTDKQLLAALVTGSKKKIQEFVEECLPS